MDRSVKESGAIETFIFCELTTLSMPCDLKNGIFETATD